MSDSSAAESGRTALRVAAVVLLVLVVAPFVVTGVPSVVGAEESFVVLSGSMNDEPEPIIKPGDVVIVDGVDPATIEEQDIITFTTGSEEPVTHRVVNVTEQNGQRAFRTKGDANEDADQQLVGPDQVIGKVMVVIPLIGHVVNFANTTQGFVLLVLLPIGLLVLSEVWNLVASSGGSSGESAEGEESAGADRAPPAGTEGRAGAGAEAAADVDEEDDGSGPATVSLGRTQVGWVAIGLVPIAAAAGYAAFRLQEAWILTGFFASVGLLILSTLLYLRIRWGSAESAETPEATGPTEHPAGAPGPADGVEVDYDDGSPPTAAVARPVVEEGDRRDPVVRGRIEGFDTYSLVEVSVDSREELVEMAVEKGTWVVHDTDIGAYVLVDDGMLFRHDDGATGATEPDRTGVGGTARGDGSAAEPASEWEEASGWITFSGDGETGDRTNGSDGGTGRSDGEAHETAPTAVSGPANRDSDSDGGGTETDTDTSDGTDVETDTGASDGTDGTDGRPAWELTPIDVGEAPSDDATASSWSDEDVTPAIRRVGSEESDENEESEAEAADDATSTPARSEGADEATDGSVRTDGGTDGSLPTVVGGVGRLARLPVQMLGFIGYLVIEPPMAFYRLLRSSDPEESSPRTDGRSEDES